MDWWGVVLMGAGVLLVVESWASRRWWRKFMTVRTQVWACWAQAQADALEHVVLVIDDLARIEPERAESLEIARLELLAQQEQLRRLPAVLDAAASGSVLRMLRAWWE